MCVIFSRECMHTAVAIACWDYSFFVLEGGTPGDELIKCENVRSERFNSENGSSTSSPILKN